MVLMLREKQANRFHKPLCTCMQGRVLNSALCPVTSVCSWGHSAHGAHYR